MVFQKDYNPISCSDFRAQLKIVQILVNNSRVNMEDFNKLSPLDLLDLSLNKGSQRV